MPNAVSVDLNADLGEGYGRYTCGDDEALLSVVTSANVACGFHAGDPEIMARVFASARRHGVAVGAHPGFDDLWGFGRRRIPVSAGEVERLLAYQIGAAQALAIYAGHRVTYVKVHGALANLSYAEPDLADAIARAVVAVDPSLKLLCAVLTEQGCAADRHGLAIIGEVYADRGYDEAGRLVARGAQGAMIEDAETAAARVLAMLEEGAVITRSGRRLPAEIASICVHGDTPHAVAMAALLRRRIDAAGICLAPFA